jgi:hypothetical protein
MTSFVNDKSFEDCERILENVGGDFFFFYTILSLDSCICISFGA